LQNLKSEIEGITLCINQFNPNKNISNQGSRQREETPNLIIFSLKCSINLDEIMHDPYGSKNFRCVL